MWHPLWLWCKLTYSNQPIFLFPKQMVVCLIEDLLGKACLTALPDPSRRLEIGSFTSTILSGPRGRCAYCWGHQYFSAMALLDEWQPCWSFGHQHDLHEVGVPLYLGLAIPRYTYGSTNLVGSPGCVTFLRSVCFVESSANLLWIPRILHREWRPPRGVRADWPCQVSPSTWALLIWDLPKIDMPWVALRDSLQLCRIYGCLYTPLAENQHFLILHRWPFWPLQKTSSCNAPFKILLGIPRNWT
jgi:hypothetical protein